MAGNVQDRGLGNGLGSSYIFIQTNFFSIFSYTYTMYFDHIHPPIILPFSCYLSLLRQSSFYMKSGLYGWEEKHHIFLVWLILFNTVISLSVAQFHSFTWLNYTPLCSTSHFLYLFIHWQTSVLIRYLGCCEWSCGSHGYTGICMVPYILVYSRLPISIFGWLSNLHGGFHIGFTTLNTYQSVDRSSLFFFDDSHFSSGDMGLTWMRHSFDLHFILG